MILEGKTEDDKEKCPQLAESDLAIAASLT